MRNPSSSVKRWPVRRSSSLRRRQPDARLRAKRTGLFLLCPAMEDPRTAEVRELLAAFPGKTPVYFRFRDSGKLLLAPKNLWTDISEPVLRRLRTVLGEDCVVYRP